MKKVNLNRMMFLAAIASIVTVFQACKKDSSQVEQVREITLSQTELTMAVGDTATLTVEIKPEDVADKALSWSSSDENTVDVDQNGKLIAKALGEAEITAKAGDKTAVCKVMVKQPKMTFTTDKAVGEKIRLIIDTKEEDRADCWIDLNNNGTKDAKEEITKFGNTLKIDSSDEYYTLGAQSITIYGKINFLECWGNALTSLDVSENKALAILSCHNNKLTSLDVSKNQVLVALDCEENQLTSLNVANGNNENFILIDEEMGALSAEENPTLNCIMVDEGFTPPSSWRKDTTAYWNNTDEPCVTSEFTDAEGNIQPFLEAKIIANFISDKYKLQIDYDGYKLYITLDASHNGTSVDLSKAETGDGEPWFIEVVKGNSHFLEGSGEEGGDLYKEGSTLFIEQSEGDIFEVKLLINYEDENGDAQTIQSFYKGKPFQVHMK